MPLSFMRHICCLNSQNILQCCCYPYKTSQLSFLNSCYLFSKRRFLTYLNLGPETSPKIANLYLLFFLSLSSILMIERSVSVCYFKIAIFHIFFSNTKWIQVSLESLMIELYLHIKIYLDYFPGRLKNAELRKSTRLAFRVPVPKAVEVVS